MSKIEAKVVRSDSKYIFNISNFKNNYKIYFSIANNMENKKLLVEGNLEEIEVDHPLEKRRLFFEVTEGCNTTGAFSTRLMEVSSIDNFRDIGGYETEDGRTVKWGVFYRCASLGAVNAEDKAYLEKTGIKTIFDLRSESEVNAEKDVELYNCKYLNESGIKDMEKGLRDNMISDKENFDMLYMLKKLLEKPEKFAEVEAFLMSGYESMVIQNDAFKVLFQTIKNDKRLPLVFHCAAGKDRTGVAGALILLALGVSEENVIKDYCLSNVYREAINEIQLGKVREFIKDEKLIESIKSLFMVREEYILLTLNKIKAEFGSFQNYFISGLELTETELENFKNIYLY